jgi:pyruvate/2-oxoglutarate dehydrogenase complex dihydrolipoamide acyltransferase (E2) component
MMLAALLLSAAAAPALADGMARPVRIAPVHFEEREQSITITGEVVARVETELSFRVGGRITGWFVDVGDAVREGEVLARLDPEEQKADVEAAEAGVRAAEAQLKLARTNFDRQKSLLNDGIRTRRPRYARPKAPARRQSPSVIRRGRSSPIRSCARPPTASSPRGSPRRDRSRRRRRPCSPLPTTARATRFSMSMNRCSSPSPPRMA